MNNTKNTLSDKKKDIPKLLKLEAFINESSTTKIKEETSESFYSINSNITEVNIIKQLTKTKFDYLKVKKDKNSNINNNKNEKKSAIQEHFNNNFNIREQNQNKLTLKSNNTNIKKTIKSNNTNTSNNITSNETKIGGNSCINNNIEMNIKTKATSKLESHEFESDEQLLLKNTNSNNILNKEKIKMLKNIRGDLYSPINFEYNNQEVCLSPNYHNSKTVVFTEMTEIEDSQCNDNNYTNNNSSDSDDDKLCSKKPLFSTKLIPIINRKSSKYLDYLEDDQLNKNIKDNKEDDDENDNLNNGFNYTKIKGNLITETNESQTCFNNKNNTFLDNPSSSNNSGNNNNRSNSNQDDDCNLESCLDEGKKEIDVMKDNIIEQKVNINKYAKDHNFLVTNRIKNSTKKKRKRNKSKILSDSMFESNYNYYSDTHSDSEEEKIKNIDIDIYDTQEKVVIQSDKENLSLYYKNTKEKVNRFEDLCKNKDLEENNDEVIDVNYNIDFNKALNSNISDSIKRSSNKIKINKIFSNVKETKDKQSSEITNTNKTNDNHHFSNSPSIKKDTNDQTKNKTDANTNSNTNNRIIQSIIMNSNNNKHHQYIEKSNLNNINSTEEIDYKEIDNEKERLILKLESNNNNKLMSKDKKLRKGIKNNRNKNDSNLKNSTNITASIVDSNTNSNTNNLVKHNNKFSKYKYNRKLSIDSNSNNRNKSEREGFSNIPSHTVNFKDLNIHSHRINNYNNKKSPSTPSLISHKNKNNTNSHSLGNININNYIVNSNINNYNKTNSNKKIFSNSNISIFGNTISSSFKTSNYFSPNIKQKDLKFDLSDNNSNTMKLSSKETKTNSAQTKNIAKTDSAPKTLLTQTSKSHKSGFEGNKSISVNKDIVINNANAYSNTCTKFYLGNILQSKLEIKHLLNTQRSNDSKSTSNNNIKSSDFNQDSNKLNKANVPASNNNKASFNNNTQKIKYASKSPIIIIDHNIKDLCLEKNKNNPQNSPLLRVNAKIITCKAIKKETNSISNSNFNYNSNTNSSNISKFNVNCELENFDLTNKPLKGIKEEPNKENMLTIRNNNEEDNMEMINNINKVSSKKLTSFNLPNNNLKNKKKEDKEKERSVRKIRKAKKTICETISTIHNTMNETNLVSNMNNNNINTVNINLSDNNKEKESLINTIGSEINSHCKALITDTIEEQSDHTLDNKPNILTKTSLKNNNKFNKNYKNKKKPIPIETSFKGFLPTHESPTTVNLKHKLNKISNTVNNNIGKNKVISHFPFSDINKINKDLLMSNINSNVNSQHSSNNNVLKNINNNINSSNNNISKNRMNELTQSNYYLTTTNNNNYDNRRNNTIPSVTMIDNKTNSCNFYDSNKTNNKIFMANNINNTNHANNTNYNYNKSYDINKTTKNCISDTNRKTFSISEYNNKFNTANNNNKNNAGAVISKNTLKNNFHEANNKTKSKVNINNNKIKTQAIQSTKEIKRVNTFTKQEVNKLILAKPFLNQHREIEKKQKSSVISNNTNSKNNNNDSSIQNSNDINNSCIVNNNYSNIQNSSYSNLIGNVNIGINSEYLANTSIRKKTYPCFPYKSTQDKNNSNKNIYQLYNNSICNVKNIKKKQLKEKKKKDYNEGSIELTVNHNNQRSRNMNNNTASAQKSKYNHNTNFKNVSTDSNDDCLYKNKSNDNINLNKEIKESISIRMKNSTLMNMTIKNTHNNCIKSNENCRVSKNNAIMKIQSQFIMNNSSNFNSYLTGKTITNASSNLNTNTININEKNNERSFNTRIKSAYKSIGNLKSSNCNSLNYFNDYNKSLNANTHKDRDSNNYINTHNYTSFTKTAKNRMNTKSFNSNNTQTLSNEDKVIFNNIKHSYNMNSHSIDNRNTLSNTTRMLLNNNNNKRKSEVLDNRSNINNTKPNCLSVTNRAANKYNNKYTNKASDNINSISDLNNKVRFSNTTNKDKDNNLKFNRNYSYSKLPETVNKIKTRFILNTNNNNNSNYDENSHMFTAYKRDKSCNVLSVIDLTSFSQVSQVNTHTGNIGKLNTTNSKKQTKLRISPNKNIENFKDSRETKAITNSNTNSNNYLNNTTRRIETNNKMKSSGIQRFKTPISKSNGNFSNLIKNSSGNCNSNINVNNNTLTNNDSNNNCQGTLEEIKEYSTNSKISARNDKVKAKPLHKKSFDFTDIMQKSPKMNKKKKTHESNYGSIANNSGNNEINNNSSYVNQTVGNLNSSNTIQKSSIADNKITSISKNKYSKIANTENNSKINNNKNTTNCSLGNKKDIIDLNMSIVSPPLNGNIDLFKIKDNIKPNDLNINSSYNITKKSYITNLNDIKLNTKTSEISLPLYEEDDKTNKLNKACKLDKSANTQLSPPNINSSNTQIINTNRFIFSKNILESCTHRQKPTSTQNNNISSNMKNSNSKTSNNTTKFNKKGVSGNNNSKNYNNTSKSKTNTVNFNSTNYNGRVNNKIKTSNVIAVNLNDLTSTNNNCKANNKAVLVMNKDNIIKKENATKRNYSNSKSAKLAINVKK